MTIINNAFELYEAAFDSACDYVDYTPEYVQSYAEGALNKYVSGDIANKIAACAVDFRDNGNGTNDYFHMIEKPLKEIAL